MLENLPNSIVKLKFCFNFNQPLTNLHNSIKIISINRFSKYNKELSNLPNFLEKLYLPIKYNKVINGVNYQCIAMTILES